METAERPDLFDVKFVRDELLYYARDENQFRRRRLTFLFALWPDLVDTQVKDAELPYQRIIVLLAWLVVLVRRLVNWLGADALSMVVVFVDDYEPQPLAAERALLEMVLRDLLQSGALSVQLLPTFQHLQKECSAHARRSLCHCLTVSTQDRAWEAKDIERCHLKLAGPTPKLAGPNIDTPHDTTGMDSWATALGCLLAAWV
jgi:hypothetical protein